MLIDRIERHIIEQVSLPETYEEYKPAIEERYAGVKKHLLTTKCRTFSRTFTRSIYHQERVY